MNIFPCVCRKGEESSAGNSCGRLPEAWGDLHHGYGWVSLQAPKWHLKSLTGSYPTVSAPWTDSTFLGKWALPSYPHHPSWVLLPVSKERWQCPWWQEAAQCAEASVMCGGRGDGWLGSPLFQLLEKKGVLPPLSWGLACWGRDTPNLCERVKRKALSTGTRGRFPFVAACYGKSGSGLFSGYFWPCRASHSAVIQSPQRQGDPIYWGAEGNACSILCVSPFNSLSSLLQTEKSKHKKPCQWICKME